MFAACGSNGQTSNYNYYFGNLHSHTGLSDGNKDSLTSGVSKPDGSYAYAKLSNDFDFLGISEHNHYSSNNNPGFKRSSYQVGLNMADQANEEGNFLALFGMEYGISSGNNGHVIIYGFNQLIGWESSTPNDPTNNYDIYNAKSDYTGLFTKVKNNPNAFCYLAHPSYGDYSNDGDAAHSIANEAYNKDYDDAIVGVPLRNGLATNPGNTYSNYATTHYFNYYKKLLYLGYHVGIGYDHDNHYTNFGRGNGGRLVIMAPSLTRANLFSAMKEMHFYGSDDSNARIDFNLNGNIMGSIVSGNYYPIFNVTHSDPDGEQADTIKIWKGYQYKSGLWADIVQVVNQSNTMVFYDTDIVPGKEYFYFAEIKQKDNQWIVTSPIWYTSHGKVEVSETDVNISFNCFPNPVSGELNVSMAHCSDYRITVQDVTGRVLSEEAGFEKNFTIDLSRLEKGVYTISVRSGYKSVSRRIIVE